MEQPATERPILITADDAVAADLLAALLAEELDVPTLVAYDAAEALVRAVESAPSVVLLDWRLPNDGGALLARAMRTYRQLDRTAIVAVDPPTAEDVRGIGCDDTLAERFDVSAVLATARVWIEGRPPAA